MASQVKLETPAQMRGRLKDNIKSIVRRIGNGEITFPYEVAIKSSKFSNASFLSVAADHRVWIQQWKSFKQRDVSVRIESRNLKDYKNVELAKSLTFANSKALLKFAGAVIADRMSLLCERMIGLGFPNSLDKIYSFSAREQIIDLEDGKFDAFQQLVDWRRENRSTDTALREVRIEGLDTKWVEQNKGLVLAVFDALGLSFAEDGCFLERAGFRNDDKRELWVKMNPEDGSLLPGITEFGVRPNHFTRKPQGITRVLMVENGTTFHSFFPSAGTLILWGNGKMASSAVEPLEWLDDVEFFYWGDCDSSGFLILDRVRAQRPGTISLMMDLETVTNHDGPISQDDAVETAKVPELFKIERDARELLLAKTQRIEQEHLKDAFDILSEYGLVVHQKQPSAAAIVA